MFIQAIKKAIIARKTEQHTSSPHPGLCEMLSRVAQSPLSFFRKPIEWKRQGQLVCSLWATNDEFRPLQVALASADSQTRTKWAQQLIKSAETFNFACETLLYEVTILVNAEEDIVLDVSGCHHPVPFHESKDRHSNKMVFWLAIAPNLPAQSGWRSTFCQQQWLGEALYQIFEGEESRPYKGSLLHWFYSSQVGNQDGFPTYNEPSNLSPELASVLRKMLTLEEGRYSDLSAAIGAAKNAMGM